jgi:hypothetical protein
VRTLTCPCSGCPDEMVLVGIWTRRAHVPHGRTPLSFRGFRETKHRTEIRTRCIRCSRLAAHTAAYVAIIDLLDSSKGGLLGRRAKMQGDGRAVKSVAEGACLARKRNIIAYVAGSASLNRTREP